MNIGTDTALTHAEQVVAHLALPAGDYVVSASLRATNSEAGVGTFYCDLVLPNRTTETITDLQATHDDGAAVGMALINATASRQRERPTSAAPAFGAVKSWCGRSG